MKTEHIKDYLWSQMLLSIDNDDLLYDCLEIEKYLGAVLKPTEGWKNTTYTSFTGREYLQYNIFTLPSVQMMYLFDNIRRVVKPYLNPSETYMIQCWLNVYRKDGHIGWHNHWPAHFRAFHGFYCVNTEDVPSYTEYKFECTRNDVTRVDSKNGLLVYGKSENDIHRSSVGWNADVPRVTIAFDIIPTASIQNQFRQNFVRDYPLNHFIPF